MRLSILRGVLLAFMLALLITPIAAHADGVIVVEPPQCDPACPTPTYVGDQLVVKNHHVQVAIDNQVATTPIDQTFFNQNSWTAEGTYIFPIPEGATVDQFTMTVDGQEVQAQVLDADQARRIYEDIVRSMRDPALLEYVGQGAIQASIFPIEPGTERQVSIRYQQVLPSENGLVRYVYPLNTERFSAMPETLGLKSGICGGDVLAGSIFPEPWMAGGESRTRLDDAAGFVPLLVCRDLDDEATASFRTSGGFVASLGSSLVDEGGRLASLLSESEAILVRPDRYVFGRGPVAALLASWQGYLASGMVSGRT